MGRIIEFLKKRWVIQLLGIIAISLLIWFVGPLIAIAGVEPLAGEIVRAITILLLIIFWLISLYIAHLKAAKANREMVEAIADSSHDNVGMPHQQESGEERRLLTERFEEAIRVLQRSGGKDKDGKPRKANLYELPWYIIIGPPGSGKTTALINSGLHFPLSEAMGESAIRGVGGTRNCDWWFSNEAVLLDTAGRYTTQDSHQQVDHSAWISFLELLKRHRSRRPINGAIVAMSLSDIMVQSDEERNQHSLAIRKRLQELHDYLGIRVPIYVMLTKSDLVAGFNEFFDDLSREERIQVWGHTFPLQEESQTSGVVFGFPDAFDQLLARLNARVLARIQDERDVHRRSRILGYPRQLAMLKEPLCSFLQETFQPNRFEHPPLLRGIYFTSGTQEGTPIDRLLGTLANTFKLERAQVAQSFSGSGRSFFINRLLGGIIFREAGLVGVDHKVERRRTLLQSAGYIGALALIGLGVAAWITSFTQNQLAIGALESEVANYQAVALQEADWSTDATLLLPELDSSRKAAGIFSEDDPVTMGFGLYQGRKLDPPASGAYQRILKKRFYPTIKMRLEERLAQTGGDQTEMLYELLKVYLMMGDTERLDAEVMRPWIMLDWEQQLAQEPDKLERLGRHLDALLALNPDRLKLDEQLIADTRAVLTRVPLAQQIFGRLKADAARDEQMDFRLSELFTPETEDLFVDGGGQRAEFTIPGFFTKAGYQAHYMKSSLEMIKNTLSSGWVLGETGERSSGLTNLAKLRQDIDALYFAEYEKQWTALLSHLYVRGFSSLSDATGAMEQLSGAVSPIRLILEAVVENTSIAKLSAGEKVAKNLGKEAVDKAAGTTGRALRLARRAGVGGQENPAKVVDRRFAPLHRLIRGEPGETPLDRLLQTISELHDYLIEISGSPDVGDNALSMAKGGAAEAGKEVVERLRRQAVRLPRPVNRWVKSLTKLTWKNVIGEAKSHLNKMWAESVARECRNSFENRYPFHPKSKDQATLLDFGRFFGEGGTMDSFFSEHLARFIDTRGRNWKLKKGSNQSVKISPATLAQLQRAATIKDLYFSQGGQAPAVEFGLRPMSLDADMAKFALNLDGQIASYQHGPARLHSFKWPGPNGTERVTISFEDLQGKLASRTKEGPWAWFRVLEEAEMKQSSQADRYTIKFEHQGHKAEFELRAKSVINPFRTAELSKFRCPDRL